MRDEERYYDWYYVETGNDASTFCEFVGPCLGRASELVQSEEPASIGTTQGSTNCVEKNYYTFYAPSCVSYMNQMKHQVW